MILHYHKNRIYKLIALAIGFFILFPISYSYSQSKDKVLSAQETQRKKMRRRDSIMRTLIKSDTSVNTLLQKFEEYTTTFNQINNGLKYGLDTVDISQQLPEIQNRIADIVTLSNAHKSSTLRYLFVLRDNLDHVQETLESWQSGLSDISAKLVQNQNDLQRFTKDSLVKVVPADSALRRSFWPSRRAVRRRFREVDSINNRALISLNVLQHKVSQAYITVLDQTDQIDSKIERFGIRALSSEYNYIWELKPEYNNFKPALKETLALNQHEFLFFATNDMFIHSIGLLFLIFIFIWITFVRTKALQTFDQPETTLSQAAYIFWHPVISPLIVALIIVPFLYDHPPVAFLEIMFTLAIFFLLFIVKKELPKTAFNFLLQLFWLTLIYSVSNLFIEVSNVDRIVILLLSAICITIALIFLNKFKHQPSVHLPHTLVIVRIFITLQIISIICNITGRFSLAKIIGVTAVYNLWLLLGLYFVVNVILQALFLQVEVKKKKNTVNAWLDYELLQQKFRKALTIVAAVLWLFTLSQNLNIEDWGRDQITDILNQNRTVGGASFTFGGFIIFIVVIWLSSMVAKIISYFYDAKGRVQNISLLKKKNLTSILLIRLAVFAVGFLLAVAASGFPLDKLTIIISAFGIGIGFGLQNIVNNLVSGLILAFERPVQIGDIIEVDNRSGTIMEIGIRSSKIATGDGAEVIIPNGDLISHHVVNWTLSNTNRRIELVIGVAYGSDIPKVKQLLTDILSNSADIMTEPAPVVFVHNLNQSTVDFRMLFWAADINHWQALKSRILSEVYALFDKEGVKLPFPQRDVHVYFDKESLPASLTSHQENDRDEEKKTTNKRGASKSSPDRGQ